MSEERMRIRIGVPRAVLKEIDALVGARHRGEFFAEAVEEKLTRAKLARVAAAVAGSLADVDIPGWETSESAAEWVASLRREDSGRLAELPSEW